jgi:hypothetical protein
MRGALVPTCRLNHLAAAAIVIVQDVLAESITCQHLSSPGARLTPRRLKAGEPLVAAAYNRNRRLAQVCCQHAFHLCIFSWVLGRLISAISIEYGV